jgi:hypothetical protein
VGRRSVLPLGGAGRVNDKKVNEEDGKRSGAAKREVLLYRRSIETGKTIEMDASRSVGYIIARSREKRKSFSRENGKKDQLHRIAQSNYVAFVRIGRYFERFWGQHRIILCAGSSASVRQALRKKRSESFVDSRAFLGRD